MEEHPGGGSLGLRSPCVSGAGAGLAGAGRRGGAEASPRAVPLAAGPGGRKGTERGPTPLLPEPIAWSAERK